MTTPLAVMIGVLAVGLLYVTIPGILDVLATYRKRYTVRCPETGRDATVKVNVGHAALTSTYGRPDLRVAECSRWPERHDCDQACLARPEGHGARPELRPAS
jgi:hypothetical protein